MTPAEIQILIGSLTAIFTALGLGMKWMLMYIEKNQLKATVAESTARTELSTRLHDEIKVLRDELNIMHAEKKIYLRRIFQLEAFIHTQPGISIPILDGWPPL